MSASTFHEWVSTRASVRVRVLLFACLVAPVSAISYAQTEAPHPAQATVSADSTVEARFAKGMALAAGDETAAAIEILAQLTKEYPRLPEPHVQLAALYVKQGDTSKALASLRAALALRADDARVQAALGDLYVTLAARAYRAAAAAGASERAQQKYRALEQLDPRTEADGRESP